MSVDRVLSRILGSGAAAGFAGGLAGGVASGLLTSKSGRKLGKKALKAGGIAVVGGLAYAAYRRYQDESAAAAPGAPASPVEPAPASFVPPPHETEQVEALGLTLLRAMVAAAQADGRLDPRERREIHERIDALGLSVAERAVLRAEVDRPVELNGIVTEARTPEVAAEIYTASLLAIDVDTAAERAYLALLAARLGLPDALVESIHREVGIDGGPAARGPGRDAA